MAPRERFNQELALLHKEIVDMGAQVHGVLRKTIKVLRENDTELAGTVVRGDFTVNAMERRIEQLCLRLITRESPIAGDLRAITGTLKIITDLERTADQCADICEIMERDDALPDLHAAQMLPGMLEEACQQYDAALDSFFTKNEQTAQHVCHNDESINQQFTQCIAGVAESIRKQPNDVTQAVDCMMIAKYIERIGDHATNIAEWAIYLASGRHPREIYLQKKQ